MSEPLPAGERTGGAESGPWLGVLLAGGRSERMGRPKAELAFGEDTMLGACARALRSVTSRALLAGADRIDPAVATAAGFEEADLLADAIPEAGPLAAIVAGLEAAAGSGSLGIVVLACDMPLVTSQELRPLMAAVESGADAALWRVGGLEQPLCAAYASDLSPRARRLLESGARRPVALLRPAATNGRPPVFKSLDPDQNSRDRLMNVNTETDYDLARQRSR